MITTILAITVVLTAIYVYGAIALYYGFKKFPI